MKHLGTSPPSSAPRKDLKALRTLLPYLWPADSLDFRIRVMVALTFLAVAKVANVVVPLIYKQAVDVLSQDISVVLVLPLGLLLAYGLVRVFSVVFGELRDAIFAKVSARAIRTVALKTFRHLHRLSLRFHLERQTGGLSRAIERGTKGIEFLLTFMLFNVLPTLLEIGLVCIILWRLYDVWFALVTFVTISGYIWFTLAVTEWRIKFRREMNATDSEANTKAIDSLLNFETVKYFCNEEHEARRYDVSLRRHEKAAVKSKTSLSTLNIGQGAIIAVGLTCLMIMAGRGVVLGSMGLGDFVLVNTYLIQLFLPLNFLGFVYREIKQSLIDMETMFSLLDKAADLDRPGADGQFLGEAVDLLLRAELVIIIVMRGEFLGRQRALQFEGFVLGDRIESGARIGFTAFAVPSQGTAGQRRSGGRAADRAQTLEHGAAVKKHRFRRRRALTDFPAAPFPDQHRPLPARARLLRVELGRAPRRGK